MTFADDQTITLTLSGSATEGAANDYTIAPASIAISAGAMSGTATITALDDTEVEDAETIDIAASHGSVEIGSATVTISANDQTAFTLAVSPDTIAEGEVATVTVSTGGVTFAADQTITLTLSGSATEGATNDYTIAPASIAIRGRSDDHPHAERQRHRGCGERLHDCAGEHRDHRGSDVGDGDDHGAERHRGGRWRCPRTPRPSTSRPVTAA